MLNHIGYPEFIVNNTALIEYYAGVSMTSMKVGRPSVKVVALC